MTAAVAVITLYGFNQCFADHKDIIKVTDHKQLSVETAVGHLGRTYCRTVNSARK